MREPKKYLMVIANYKDSRQQFFETYMSPRNKLYCQIHGYEYLEYTQDLPMFRGNHTWNKFKIVQQLIENGSLKDGDKLVHLDADMCIVKPELEYPCDKSFSYSIDNANSQCMGSYAMIVNDWSKHLVDMILDEDRYQKYKDKITRHDHFGFYNSFWGDFREQASFYSLVSCKRHSSISYFDTETYGKNYGWYSDKDEPKYYSLEELHNNITVLGPEWNTTIVEGEQNDCTFLINKVEKKDIIIRHWAAGIPWNPEYFDIKK
jgi:hypothetical protein